MKSTLPLLLAAAALLPLALAARSPGSKASGATALENGGAGVGRVSEASNRFGAHLYTQLAQKEKGNLFFSPFSIETALAMTYAGARGETAEQMARVLHFDLPPDQLHPVFGDLIRQINSSGDTGIEDARAFDLVVANALWADKTFPLLPAFRELVRQQYGGGLQSLDFAGSAESREDARRTINQWVEKQTHDKIKDLLAPEMVRPDTRLILTNAVYFKSRWEEPFQPQSTKDESFHADPADGSAGVNVPMMHQTKSFNYGETADYQVVELPYSFDRLSMVVMLPKKPHGLDALEKSLNERAPAPWQLPVNQHEVELSLPKFKLTTHFDLAKTLEAMGMKGAFGAANFSGMTASERVAISDVVHQADVDVDEEGTEAAAATAVAAGRAAVRPQSEKVAFRADHPFLFAIRHNESGAILFLGRVVSPNG